MGVSGKSVLDFETLAAEWHETRNAPVNPAAVPAGSNKKYWWRCSKGHEFLSSPNGRTNNGRATGRVGTCPHCYAELIDENSLSWDEIVARAKHVVDKEGFLPPAAYFQKNDNGNLIHNLYKSGKTWADLRTAVGSFDGSTFVESRSGQRWLSHAEASLSNFLYARGISHDKGRRYPTEYEAFSGRKSGFYDLHFQSRSGDDIDVEIWGDKPHPDAEERYAETRRLKEEFHGNRKTFLGIHHLDCHSDKTLERLLFPYLGEVPPFVFDKPHDRVIESSHWSNADELIETC